VAVDFKALLSSYFVLRESNYRPTNMFALINRILDWFKSLFWKEEMELTLVGLQYSGKTTFVNVIAVMRHRSEVVNEKFSTFSLFIPYSLASSVKI
jgi:hypothetical protein